MEYYNERIFNIDTILSGLRIYHIPTMSMEDTIKRGDYIVARVYSRKPVRGDIIMFFPPGKKKILYVKRCIPVSGDKFEISKGKVYLNGNKLDEPYLKGRTDYKNDWYEKNINGVVPHDKIVVLGDNRNYSLDSRHFGYVDLRSVRGRAVFIFLNFRTGFSRFGIINKN